jgi:hypothetical protein
MLMPPGWLIVFARESAEVGDAMRHVRKAGRNAQNKPDRGEQKWKNDSIHLS